VVQRKLRHRWSIAYATEEIRNNDDADLTPQEKNALVMEHRRLQPDEG
jgi:hypothetical protein